ncbi:hypothetical protein [Curtobacterium sp. MCSS17_015]|uniref:hypothetical protein n=1 Tax=Curtobacterium sp. MCSS17_015 TaxID=2175666 RepID=UPI0011B7ADFD|nr:hypothetical protein [Curtobacterium sp. MCSS17_015]WIB25832.1 hypothetical protein DEJ18_12350 [Curtobacterium sp. MCSS17_015]
MTPLEELQAAYARLSDLRLAPMIDGDTGYGAGSAGPSELSLTLHRTIDVQLSILEGDIALVECFGGQYSGDGLALARAINGDGHDHLDDDHDDGAGMMLIERELMAQVQQVRDAPKGPALQPNPGWHTRRDGEEES